MRRVVHLAADVAARLDGGVRGQLDRQLQSGVTLRCDVCPRPVSPADPVSVRVRRAPPHDGKGALTVVYVVHATCGPSGVEHVASLDTSQALPKEGAVDVLLALRGCPPHAMLLWETASSAYGYPPSGSPELVDLIVEQYIRGGFTLLLSLSQLGALPPALAGWQVRLADGELRVLRPDGSPALEDAAVSKGPPGWTGAAMVDRAVVAVTGTGLEISRLARTTGLDGLTPAIRRGQLVAAVLRFTTRPRG